MLTIRAIGTAILGAAVLTGVTVSYAPARECENQFPWTCNVPPRAAEPAKLTDAEPPVRTAQPRAPRAAKRKKNPVASRQRKHADDDDGTILTGQDTVTLIAWLPWWRSDLPHVIEAKISEIASPVLTTADALVPSPSVVVQTQLVDGIRIASADDLNEIDEAAAASFAEARPADVEPAAPANQPPVDQSWLQYLFATLGGFFAAISAALMG
jgi:hypothetical protein